MRKSLGEIEYLLYLTHPMQVRNRSALLGSSAQGGMEMDRFILIYVVVNGINLLIMWAIAVLVPTAYKQLREEGIYKEVFLWATLVRPAAWLFGRLSTYKFVSGR